jgi:hypothetical protein
MHRWRLRIGPRKFSKGKHMLIEHNMPRYVDTISGNIKTFVAFVKGTIAKKDTLFGPKFELTLIVGT